MKKNFLLISVFIFTFLFLPFCVKAKDISYFNLIKSNNALVILNSTINEQSVKKLGETKDVSYKIESYSFETPKSSIRKMASTTTTSGSSMPDLSPTNIISCDDELRQTVRNYWKYITLLAPILLIVMGSVDFIKAVMSSNQDAIKKSSSAALKRAIATILLIYLPLLLRVIFTWFGLENSLCF